MRSKISRYIQLLVFATAIILVPAALVTGCKSTLAPGGSYAPGSFVVSTDPSGVTTTNFVADAIADKGFFAVDSSYDLAYSILDAAFVFEKENRLALWQLTPQIKHTLDSIRPKAWDANMRYAAARKAYQLNPTPGGLTTLQTILAELQNLTNAAQAAVMIAKKP